MLYTYFLGGFSNRFNQGLATASVVTGLRDEDMKQIISSDFIVLITLVFV
jgi:hypothetical protein